MRRLLIIGMFTLILLAATPLLAQQADEGRPSFTFQIVLLVANGGASESLDGLPENVVPALKDVKGFLPFKSYSLLDVGLTRSNRVAEGMINGPDDRDYRWGVNFKTDPGGKLIDVMEFGLTDRSGDDGPVRLINSSFKIHVGETIVVGTSKLNGGGKALVALLTVVP